MITLDQIRALDSKVQQAVEEIESLRNENTRLRSKLTSYEKKVSELEVLIDGFKTDQGEIEEGIQKALLRLDVLSNEPNNNAMEDRIEEEQLQKPSPADVKETVAEALPLEAVSKESENGASNETEAEIQPEELDIF